MTTDALGQEIVIGFRYGYSQSSNGHTYVRVGRAQRIPSEGKVSLKLEYIGHSIYNDPISPQTLKVKSITCKASMLFPVM